MKEFKFTNTFGDTLYGHCWELKEAKEVVLICTGMAEHSGRYEDFAKFLNKCGYGVYCLDHYGQGKNGELGHGGPDFFHRMEKTLDEMVQKFHEVNVKVNIFSHSMGSFVTQGYLQRFGNCDKAVICGTNFMGGLGKISYLLAKVLVNKKNWDKPAGLLNDLAVGGYSKKCKGQDSPNAWLSYNQDNYQKYDKDKLSGYHCSNGFYHDFFYGLSDLFTSENLDRIKKNIPIFIIAGQDDLVGDCGKGPKKLYDAYVARGINAKLKIYEGMKHEILNEKDHQKVYQDIADFLK